MVADYIDHKNTRAKNGDDTYTVYDPVDEVFVEKKWEEMTPHPTPSSIMADHFNMKDVNLAIPGSGNKQIHDTLVDYVIHNHENIGLVVACWSNLTRIDFPIKDPKIRHMDWYISGMQNGPGDWSPSRYYSMVFNEYADTYHNQKTLGRTYPIWKMLFDHGFVFHEASIDEFYRQVISLKAICNFYGVECVQGCSLITYPTTKEFMEYFINHPMAEHIDEDFFYGWPVFYEIGGTPLFEFRTDHFLTKEDSHPNALAHQIMADKLIKKIEDAGCFPNA